MGDQQNFMNDFRRQRRMSLAIIKRPLPVSLFQQRNQLLLERGRCEQTLPQRPRTTNGDCQCRRADGKEQYPNQKADNAAVENYISH